VYNCIYDSGQVISLEQGPCEDVLDNGAYLVDASFSGTEITVTPEDDSLSFWPWLILLGVIFLGGSRVRT
jgi:hypothetical protein